MGAAVAFSFARAFEERLSQPLPLPIMAIMIGMSADKVPATVSLSVRGVKAVRLALRDEFASLFEVLKFKTLHYQYIVRQQ